MTELATMAYHSLFPTYLYMNVTSFVLECELIDESKVMKLSDQKGELVPRFNHKILTKCKEITQVGPAPRDLSNLVVKCCLHTQLIEF